MSQLSAIANWRAEQKLKLAAKNRKAKAARQARRAEALSRAVPHDKFHGEPITAAAPPVWTSSLFNMAVKILKVCSWVASRGLPADAAADVDVFMWP